MRSVFELFRMMKREREVHREILDLARMMKIYGYYLVIPWEKTTFYRHTVYKFNLIALSDKKEQTAYKFTKNAYDI